MNWPIFKIVPLMLTFRVFLGYIAMKSHAFIIIIIHPTICWKVTMSDTLFVCVCPCEVL